MAERTNCERKVTEMLNVKKRVMRMHQTNAQSGKLHKDVWWYGTSFDDGYLYLSQQQNSSVAPFSTFDKNCEMNLDY